MKVVHAADAHVGLYRHGRDLAEAVAPLNRFGGAIANADLAILAGDTLHTRRPTNQEKAEVARFVAETNRHGVPLIISEGNHDGKDVIADPSSATLGWLRELAPPHVRVILEPAAEVIETRAGPVAVGVLPYAHRRALVPDGSDLSDRTLEAARIIEAAIAELHTWCAAQKGMPRILIAHLSVAGSRLGAEQVMRAGYGDAVISASVLADWDYVALGHLHRAQEVPGSNGRAWYAGSLSRHDASDAGMPKGWLEVEVARGAMPVVQPVSSGARDIQVLVVPPPWEIGDLEWARDPAEPAPVVYVRFLPDGRSVVPQHIERAFSRALRMGGAYWVETRAVRPDEDAVHDDVLGSRDGQTPVDSLTAWLRDRAKVDADALPALLDVGAAIIEGRDDAVPSLGL